MAHINDSFPFAEPRHIERAEDCIFYHVMDLPGFTMPDAPWDLRGKFDDYTGRVKMKGKTVLDIGAATGFLSFEAEKRGATVVSFDISEGKYQNLLPFVQKQYYRDHATWAAERTHHFDQWKNGYWLAHRLLKSKARAFYGNIYDLPVEVGMFDVTIIGSVLEHLADPIAALTSISRLTEDTMIITTDAIDDDEPVARFMGRANNPDQDYTWWFYSLGLYREILGILGFSIERITQGKYLFTHTKTKAKRHTIVAKRTTPRS
ncbi:methyltransferase domain-containing protein [Candidatus Sumerlaeota bacterium]|nr:methyltransferase domain-containing protein [Candidatus Sumerlaeota bacterium]